MRNNANTAESMLAVLRKFSLLIPLIFNIHVSVAGLVTQRCALCGKGRFATSVLTSLSHSSVAMRQTKHPALCAVATAHFKSFAKCKRQARYFNPSAGAALATWTSILKNKVFSFS